jgi:FtsP/CotA-like multicopper oxidase with cupredoxin domain
MLSGGVRVRFHAGQLEHPSGISQIPMLPPSPLSPLSRSPITPGRDFQYDFIVSGQAGTYWYHSHFQGQYIDGLKGALIVLDTTDPYLGQFDVDRLEDGPPGNETTILQLSGQSAAAWQHRVNDEERARWHRREANRACLALLL